MAVTTPACRAQRQRHGRIRAGKPQAGFRAHRVEANPDYWGIGEFPLEVTEIIYTPIQEPARPALPRFCRAKWT
jgi:hypothetical protein